MEKIFKSTLNTRCIIGGSYRYVRSDVPTAVSEEEKVFLLEHNIRTIIDLRTAEEAEKKPCPLASAEGFTYLNMPVAGGNAVPPTTDEVPMSYINMIDKKMTEIIGTIENADTNVLYFCNAGKDRTGVVSAILLKRLGVPDEDIIADYTASADNLRAMLTDFAESDPTVDINVITPCRRYMEEFLANADMSVFGGVS